MMRLSECITKRQGRLGAALEGRPSIFSQAVLHAGVPGSRETTETGGAYSMQTVQWASLPTPTKLRSPVPGRIPAVPMDDKGSSIDPSTTLRALIAFAVTAMIPFVYVARTTTAQIGVSDVVPVMPILFVLALSYVAAYWAAATALNGWIVSQGRRCGVGKATLDRLPACFLRSRSEPLSTAFLTVYVLTRLDYSQRFGVSFANPFRTFDSAAIMLAAFLAIRIFDSVVAYRAFAGTEKGRDVKSASAFAKIYLPVFVTGVAICALLTVATTQVIFAMIVLGKTRIG